MVEIGLLKQYRDLRDNLVWIPLLGWIKGEDHVDTYLMRSVPVTSSGITVYEQRERVLTVHEAAGRNTSPAICDAGGFLMASREMNDHFWTLLETIWDNKEEELFSKSIQERDDIREKYDINRSARRSSESRATAKNISEGDQELVN